MQFNVVALVLAAMASVAAAQVTVTVTVCPSGVASSTSAPVASTGVKLPPTPSSSPISYQGAASVNAVSGSALGMIIAGGVALLL